METKINLVEVEDIQMEYFSFGKGDKNLIILPGLSLKSTMRAADTIVKAYDMFTSDYTVYVFERRKNLPEEYTIYQVAEDTYKVIKAIGIENADFFGTSQGGIMTQIIAINHPEMVNKMVLGSSLSRVNPHAYEVVSKWIEDTMAGNVEALAESFVTMLYSKMTQKLFGEKIISSCKKVTEEELHRFLIMAMTSANFNTYDQLDKIKCPAFVIGAKGDKVVTPEASIEIAEKLNCKIHMYGKRYGHAVYDEAPDYKKRIYKFLKSN